MELGFSGEGFANLITILTIIAACIIFVTLFIVYNRGITSKKFQINFTIIIIAIFIIMPLMFSRDMDILWKLITVSVASAGALLNYFIVDGTQKSVRDK